MAREPWLTIVGLGEDGAEGLSPASLAALNSAEIVMGAKRHLSLLPNLKAETITWPVPFSDGIETLLFLRGRSIVVLASGDPFWFGAGAVLARHLEPSEWRSLPNASCFALAANRLGWAMEKAHCLGLHAAPLTRLRPHLARGARFIVTLRDGDGPAELAGYLASAGFGETQLTVLEALGGPREKATSVLASNFTEAVQFAHPLCVAFEISGDGAALPNSSGLADSWFEHDGQITKRPVRALTLSSLAPRPGEHLWDIGGGSGSIAIEWLLSDPTMTATSIEANEKRSQRITRNSERLGVDHLQVVNKEAPQGLINLSQPDAVFVGGGLSRDLLDHLEKHAQGARLVANAVTLDSEALLIEAQSRMGGGLLRLEVSESQPLGSKRGWRAAYPIVQWSVTL